MTKKPIAALLAAVMALSALAMPASAVMSDAPAESAGSEVVQVGLIRKNSKCRYKICSGKTVRILELYSKAIETNGTVKLPAKINGMRVTAVESSASDFFRTNYKKIKLVDIPDSIKALPDESIGYSSKMFENKSNGSEFIYGYKRYSGTKIKCSADSYGEEYAVNNGVDYVYRNNDDKLKGVILKDKYSMGAAAIRFRWNEVKGADGYEIYRYEVYGESKLIKTIKGSSITEFKDSKLKRGAEYKYYVSAYREKNGEKEYGKSSFGLEFMTKPNALSTVKASPVKKGTVAMKVKNFQTHSFNRAEIMDPATKEWHEACFDDGNADGNDYIIYFSGMYLRNPFTGNYYMEPLESGKKYKVRICYNGKVCIYSYLRRFNGTFSKPLTLKAK